MAIRSNVQGQQAQQLQSQAQAIFTPAMPNAQNQWEGLVAVFDQAGLMADKRKKEQQQADELAAQRWANSQTVDNLGKEILSGNLEHSRSPVFVAKVQNMWGTNSGAALQRDVSSKITSGELTFADDAALDRYMVEQRNSMLSGHSDYAASGFDGSFMVGRQQFLSAMAQVRTKQAIDSGSAQSRDYLSNTLLSVTGPAFKGTPQEAAASLMGQYTMMDKTLVLPPGVLLDNLKGTLARAADTGHKDLVTALLDHHLPSAEGQPSATLRATLGESPSIQLESAAASKAQEVARNHVHEGIKPWYEQASAGNLDETKWREWAADPDRAKHLSGATIEGMVNTSRAAIERQARENEQALRRSQAEQSVATAQTIVDEAIRQGKAWALTGPLVPQVLSLNGTTHGADVKAMAESALFRQTANATPTEAAAMWAANKVDNPQWKGLLEATITNIDTIGLDATGKPVGSLNETAQQGLELFRTLNHSQPAYTKSMLGDKAYLKFTDMELLMNKMGRGPEEAALLIANAERSQIGSDGKVKAAEIHKAVGDMMAGPWYRPDWWAKAWGDNTMANTSQVQAALTRSALLLAQSGLYPEPQVALKEAASWLADPKVSTKINGTLYLRNTLPAAPPDGAPQEEWFTRFIDKVAKPQATKLGFKESETRLEYAESLHGYVVYANNSLVLSEEGRPLVYPNHVIEEWYGKERQQLIDGAVMKAMANRPKPPAASTKAGLDEFNKNFGKPRQADPAAAERARDEEAKRAAAEAQEDERKRQSRKGIAESLQTGGAAIDAHTLLNVSAGGPAETGSSGLTAPPLFGDYFSPDAVAKRAAPGKARAKAQALAEAKEDERKRKERQAIADDFSKRYGSR